MAKTTANIHNRDGGVIKCIAYGDILDNTWALCNNWPYNWPYYGLAR
jgi:hypothetical protein